MGYRTPNIDSLAKEGIMFTDFYGENSCTAGRAAFITGQASIRTGMTKLAWGQKLSIQGRASFSGSGVEEDRRVNQRVLNFPIAENPIFSLAIAKTYIPHFKM